MEESSRKPECYDCGDVGYRPKEIGSNVWVPCGCQERKRHQAALARLYAAANFPEDIQDQTIHGMDMSHPDTVTMVKAARNYIKEQEPPILAFLGRNGNGKTRVALATAKALLMNDETPVYFAYLPVFLDALQRGQFTGREYKGQDYADLIDRVAYAAGLVVLDDLGLYKATEWADLQMDKIIGYRYLNRLRTIITSNVKLAQLPVRLQSRLTDPAKCRIVAVEAPDYRPRNKPKARKA